MSDGLGLLTRFIFRDPVLPLSFLVHIVGYAQRPGKEELKPALQVKPREPLFRV